MPDPIHIVVAFNLDEELLRRIGAVDPRLTVDLVPALSGRPGQARMRDMAAVDEDERQSALRALARADILFGPGNIATPYFDAATRLKWFQVITAGVDRLAADGILNRGFEITTVSGLAAPAIAEWVMGAIVMLVKGMHTSVRDQAEHKWSFRFTAELAGKTCGIAGMGAIGRETARRAHAFGMRVIATRRTVEPGATDPDCDAILPYSDLDRLLQESDYVVLAVPLTAETHHLIGARELALMKPTASLLNVARGPVVDQDALVAALRDGTIASAALDVTDPEPLPPDSPLWDMPNVILTPHISGAVEGYGHRAAEIFIANLERYLAGQPLEHLVKRELGY